MSFFSETQVFLLCGLIVGALVLDEPWQRDYLSSWDFLKLFGYYAIANLIRYAILLIAFPLLRMCGTKLNIREWVMLGFAGLRGPTGITLSLMVREDSGVSQRAKDVVLFYMAGLACLSVWINGTTARCLIKKLRLQPEVKTQDKIEESCKLDEGEGVGEGEGTPAEAGVGG